MGWLHLIINIQGLAGHLNDGRDKSKHNANGCHSKKYTVHRFVLHKYIKKRHLTTVVGHIGHTGKGLVYFFQPTQDIAQRNLQIVEGFEDKIIEEIIPDGLHQTINTVH